MSKLEELFQEVYLLQEAEKILKEIYFEVGPYGGGEISWETRQKMNDHFGFDDSE